MVMVVVCPRIKRSETAGVFVMHLESNHHYQLLIHNESEVVKMDIATIGQLVGSIGFPIVAFMMMFYLFKDNMSKLTDTLNNNTKAITELNEYIKNCEVHKDEK